MARPDTDMTLASQSLMALHAQHGLQAVTVAGGYGVDGNGERFTLEHIPKVVDEKRNAAGRCTSATYQYADGSVLEFRWSDQLGARYQLGNKGPVAVAQDDETIKASRYRPR